jgi:hypothetical protein
MCVCGTLLPSATDNVLRNFFFFFFKYLTRNLMVIRIDSDSYSH